MGPQNEVGSLGSRAPTDENHYQVHFSSCQLELVQMILTEVHYCVLINWFVMNCYFFDAILMQDGTGDWFNTNVLLTKKV